MDNYYKIIKKRQINNSIIEYDYHNNLLKRSLSPELFNSNNFFKGFLTHINNILSNYIDSVKSIKIAANIAVDKNETYIL